MFKYYVSDGAFNFNVYTDTEDQIIRLLKE